MPAMSVTHGTHVNHVAVHPTTKVKPCVVVAVHHSCVPVHRSYVPVHHSCAAANWSFVAGKESVLPPSHLLSAPPFFAFFFDHSNRTIFSTTTIFVSTPGSAPSMFCFSCSPRAWMPCVFSSTSPSTPFLLFVSCPPTFSTPSRVPPGLLATLFSI